MIDVKHCSHKGLKGHLVPREQMTWIQTKGGWRAICEECKNKKADLSDKIKRDSNK